MGETVVVSIGRNIGAGPGQLPLSDWRAFIRQVDSDIDRVGATSYFRGEGLGQSALWGNEGAYTWVLDVPYDRVADLRVWLSVTAWRYQQDEIAWTWGRYDGVKAAVEVQEEQDA